MDDKVSVFFDACKNGNIEGVKYSVENGIDINEKNSDYNNCLNILVENIYLHPERNYMSRIILMPPRYFEILEYFIVIVRYKRNNIN